MYIYIYICICICICICIPYILQGLRHCRRPLNPRASGHGPVAGCWGMLEPAALLTQGRSKKPEETLESLEGFSRRSQQEAPAGGARRS